MNVSQNILHVYWDDLAVGTQKELVKSFVGINKNIPLLKTRIYTCIDCGIPCIRTNSRQQRCNLCQKEKYKQKNREAQKRRYRAKKELIKQIRSDALA